MSLRSTATTIAIVVPAFAFVAFMFSPALAMYSGLPIEVVYGGVVATTLLWLVGLWSARLWTPRQKAAGTLLVLGAFGFVLVAAPTRFEPMFRATPPVGNVPVSVILFTIAFIGMAVAWLWLRRAVEVEPQTHSFRSSTDESSR